MFCDGRNLFAASRVSCVALSHPETLRMMLRNFALALAGVALAAFLPAAARAANEPEKIQFTEETLDNGLHVICAPLRQAPVVHVRVLYHVGSRDERPDRQG